jgi:hypothetical protein
MIFGGIDTTGNTIGFLMYHLAANPDKQEILRKECLSIGPNLNVKNLNELRYLKACIQETFRLTPTISMLVRMLQENVTLQGKKSAPRNLKTAGILLVYQGCGISSLVVKNQLDLERDLDISETYSVMKSISF